MALAKHNSDVTKVMSCMFCQQTPFKKANNLTQHIISCHMKDATSSNVPNASSDALEATKQAISIVLRIRGQFELLAKQKDEAVAELQLLRNRQTQVGTTSPTPTTTTTTTTHAHAHGHTFGVGDPLIMMGPSTSPPGFINGNPHPPQPHYLNNIPPFQLPKRRSDRQTPATSPSDRDDECQDTFQVGHRHSQTGRSSAPSDSLATKYPQYKKRRLDSDRFNTPTTAQHNGQ
eukprot:TRINITY_DN8660_c0_g1_i2.p1 TRINITY_DN8660_c0_g1~~TRINITY_DN8660_c0_g1_i2.p1  ORF type:complete len:232 (+),score=53.30 TRINITY_DN8660_c0_g1_i2:63-758(+)